MKRALPTRSELLKFVRACIFVQDKFGDGGFRHAKYEDCPGHCMYCYAKTLLPVDGFVFCDGCGNESITEDMVNVNGFNMCTVECWTDNKQYLTYRVK